MFFNCAFLNTRRDHPNGLSTFFCVPSPILGGESLMSSEELELRKVTQNLSNSEIQKVLTSQIMLPKDGYALKATIENLLCLIDFAFTSESLFYKGIDSILSAMTKNPTTFNTMAAKDKSFIPKLMWKIDVKMHRFLESCTKAQKISDVNFQAINFTKEIDSILDSEQINIILPDSVSKIAFQTPDHQKRNRPSIDSEDTKRSSKRPTTNPATKDSNNSPWKIKTDENLKAFHEHSKDLPKFNNTQLCLKYHILGSCPLGDTCRRKSSHTTDLDQKTTDSMNSWVNKVRKDTK